MPLLPKTFYSLRGVPLGYSILVTSPSPQVSKLIIRSKHLSISYYLETQTLLAAYETELGNMRIRQQEEEESQQAYESAQSMITNLPKSVDRSNQEFAAREVLTIINQLEKVKPQTTVHADAVVMMNFANQKLKQLR